MKNKSQNAMTVNNIFSLSLSLTPVRLDSFYDMGRS